MHGLGNQLPRDIRSRAKPRTSLYKAHNKLITAAARSHKPSVCTLFFIQTQKVKPGGERLLITTATFNRLALQARSLSTRGILNCRSSSNEAPSFRAHRKDVYITVKWKPASTESDEHRHARRQPHTEHERLSPSLWVTKRRLQDNLSLHRRVRAAPLLQVVITSLRKKKLLTRLPLLHLQPLEFIF